MVEHSEFLTQGICDAYCWVCEPPKAVSQTASGTHLIPWTVLPQRQAVLAPGHVAALFGTCGD